MPRLQNYSFNVTFQTEGKLLLDLCDRNRKDKIRTRKTAKESDDGLENFKTKIELPKQYLWGKCTIDFFL